ncbi:class I SAM-dependent methyltransferase [Nocardioides panacisoli]|uniref:class I SAM-dependent methyltransferase n=1 Tax=Nocardioides panacisoli TaxID=627624 RepID=UPI001C630D06|nr:class I SAM-dependent methyltransferase [Nocardioides panacisoli]QYJ03138.1 class I SAM-dependent methyltransferase [Nocardioides panacisoli]
MTPSEPPGTSFGVVVDHYDRGRPAYPADAVDWLVGEGPLSVLELGAGSGKLTEALVAAGHDVHATDPDEAMLDRLAEKLPELRISQAGAEEIPAPDAGYDVVIAAQSYHWFDLELALPEIARVLKRGGFLSLVWNVKDERIPWVKRLGRIVGEQEKLGGPGKELETSRYFGPIEHHQFKNWQTVDRETIRDFAMSRSNISTLPEDDRAAKVAEVVAFYDEYGRGMDGMQLPYVTECFRAALGIRPEPKLPPQPPAEQAGPTGDDDVPTESAPARDGGPAVAGPEETGRDALTDTGSIDPPTDDDSGMLLIDFR